MNDLPLLVPALATVLVDFLWQGALIGLLAWLALALLRNARPQARYAVACLALLACALLPAWQLSQAVGDAAPMADARAFLAGAGLPAGVARLHVAPAFDALAPLPAPPDELLPWIVAAWGAGAAARALRMACGLLWIRRLRLRSRADHDGWQQSLDLLARRLGIRRSVALRIVADGDSPLSIGWWKPVVLLPAALALRMPVHLLEALLAHELAHVRRLDYLVNLLQGAVEVLLFYHPVTWWLSRRIRIEREQVADDIAASALGEPRRLAIALSRLDSFAAPIPTFAQAAHGGQLMSRIRQLVRPDRRTIGGIVVLPLLGLAAAGLVFAQVHPAPTAPVAPVPFAAPVAPSAPSAPAPIRATAPAAPVAPAAPAAAPAAPVPPTAPEPPASPAHRTGIIASAGAAPSATRVSRLAPHPITRIASRGDADGYALVRKDREGFTMSGSAADADAVRAARRGIDGDFLWFRRDGKPYVVRDAALLQRAEAAWAPMHALETRMQALNARMRPHQDRMQALAERMQALQAENGMGSPEQKAQAERMQALGKRMQALAERQRALAQHRQGAADDEAAERQVRELSAQQDALARDMERHAQAMEATSRSIEAKAKPIEALGQEMEAAGKPMEAVGKDMEALGRQMQEEADVADARVRGLIDEALRRDLAQPAPRRQ